MFILKTSIQFLNYFSSDDLCFKINFLIMKYYNKTRTIEQKVTDREILELLKDQNDLLKSILNSVSKN